MRVSVISPNLPIISSNLRLKEMIAELQNKPSIQATQKAQKQIKAHQEELAKQQQRLKAKKAEREAQEKDERDQQKAEAAERNAQERAAAAELLAAGRCRGSGD